METTPADRARWAVNQHVHEVAELLEGDAVRVERPSLFGPDHAPLPDVEPLAGVRAALFVSRAATGQMREYAEQARGDGVSWRQLGEALALAKDAERHDTPLDEAAWLFVVEGIRPGQDPPPHRTGHPTSSRWTCNTCGERITDRGPFEGGHPDNREEGHTTSCTRHRAALAAYEHELSTW